MGKEFGDLFNQTLHLMKTPILLLSIAMVVCFSSCVSHKESPGSFNWKFCNNIFMGVAGGKFNDLFQLEISF